MPVDSRGDSGSEEKEAWGRGGCCVHRQTRNTCAILLNFTAYGYICVAIVQARKKSSFSDGF